MTIFAKVNVELLNHHRLLRIPRKYRAQALGAWLAALLYTRLHELDGFAPLEGIEHFATRRIIERLISVGLVARDEQDGVHGIHILRYAAHNETKYEIEASRQLDRERKVPLSLKRLVIARDGWTCRICGAPVDGVDLHIDHKTPVSRGGETTLANLQVAHARCNRAKGARLQ